MSQRVYMNGGQGLSLLPQYNGAYEQFWCQINFTLRETNPGTRGARIDKNALSRSRDPHTRRRVSRTVIELHSLWRGQFFLPRSPPPTAVSFVFAERHNSLRSARECVLAPVHSRPALYLFCAREDWVCGLCERVGGGAVR